VENAVLAWLCKAEGVLMQIMHLVVGSGGTKRACFVSVFCWREVDDGPQRLVFLSGPAPPPFSVLPGIIS